MIKKHPAFTMLELIMVIVVLGILASLAMPKLDRDSAQEAADNILSNMRYTQHMALMADRHQYDDPNWQKSFWQISFRTCSDGAYFLSIGSDTSYNDSLEKNETAIDPATGKRMFTDCTTEDTAASPLVLLSAKYGINNITGEDACAGTTNLGFDHMGRPHKGFFNNNTPDYHSYIRGTCSFKFDLDDGASFTIDILPETGNMQIRDQNLS